MISGFILGAGEGAMDRVIVRALGPSLQIAGIVDRLADPALELHNANGALIASDDDWQDTQKSEIEATDLAPPNPKESAIVQTLAAGNYTAIVRGVDQTTGVGLLEVYDLH
jgi:predicted dehydrogenase